jgi:hypothetical protein
MIYEYKHADWQLFKYTLDNSIPLIPILLSTADLEQTTISFETAKGQAATKAIPLHTITRNQLTLSPAVAYQNSKTITGDATKDRGHPPSDICPNSSHQTPTTEEHKMELLSSHITPPDSFFRENN